MSDLTVTGGPRPVFVAAGRIAATPVAGAPTVDATGLLVAPGLIDLQCNGAAGIDVTAEPERLWDVSAALPRWGVTAWLPTVVTSPPDIRRRALAAWRAGPPPSLVDRPLAAPLGLHFEGPFLAPERRGAHPPEHLAPPDPAVVEAEGWAGAVAMVTLAPELPGALALIRALVDQGIVVSAGHSAATGAQARAAVDSGVTYVTHLFNAMDGLHHRAPGLAAVALTDDRLRVGVIADGTHVDPTMVALASRALGDRLSLVTDAVAALGVSDGPFRLPDGTLAGSTLGLDQAIRNLVSFAGVPLAAAVAAATTVPADLLHRSDRATLAPGAPGDLVLLDPDGHLVATVIAGRVAYDRRRPEDAPWRS